MSYLDCCIESFERRVRRLDCRLSLLEGGDLRIGFSKAGAPFECATEVEIDRIRRELREMETIIASLRARRAKENGATPG